ncbi:C2H2-type domain-containing protein [Mycena indigotica]|uniref:C2H2-type domain-containing protein n=1 Tax=Mycena indigotica TaxID=2126181 RepID=A0A8H6SWN6_9AGAR|nr:C2H2-type domain-containing protein [Mycena indigotica]KAF7306801.1 C2H2-type domain-containing protein [Mycena indigotica]
MWSARTGDLAAWNAPLEESPPLTKEERLVRAHQDHFELTSLIIPHWLVSVAEGNDMLYLEAFLDGVDYKASGGVAKSISMESTSQTGSRTTSRDQTGGWDFVEGIARIEAADESKKRRLHQFYDMSTEAKVKKIEEMSTLRPLHIPPFLMSQRPLPKGWIEQKDPNTGHTFYVDTGANPPRSIWVHISICLRRVHPLEDEQYLREHPEAREKANATPPGYYTPPAGPPTPTAPLPSPSTRPGYAPPTGPPKKRGLFGKLRDNISGSTPEQRQAEKEMEQRHKAEQREQLIRLREQRHREAMAQQAEMYRQQQMYQQQYQQQQPYGGQPQYAYGPPQQQQRSGFGGGGMALPLLGGLAGGLLIGEAMDGFGGDDGGGDFGGDF